MDPVTGKVAAYLGGKLVTVALDRLRKAVIEPFGRRRAEEFIAAFASAVVDPTTPPEEIQDKLTEILEDPTRQEVLFDSYRAVCLSRSRTVGPRAIGLLTAHIVNAQRLATDVEEAWFQVYESFSDAELQATYSFFADAFRKAQSGVAKDHKLDPTSLTIDWAVDEDSFRANADRSNFSLQEALGSWGAKLERLGVLCTRILEEVWDYDVDSERHIDEPGTARRTTYRIVLRTEDEPFAALIGRAAPAIAGSRAPSSAPGTDSL